MGCHSAAQGVTHHLTRLKKQHAESLYQMRYRLKGLGDSIQSCEREIANIREDLRTRTTTRGDNFTMTVKEETFTERVKAGRALVFLAAAMKPFQSTKAIGEIGGFPVSLHRFDERANLIIHGKSEYKANVSSPTGTISSVEHALERMEDRLRERESDLKQAHKQTKDLPKQLDHPFEREEKLAVATKRHQEIVEALDLTKNQASAKLDAGAEQLTESGDDTPQQTVRSKRANAASVAG